MPLRDSFVPASGDEQRFALVYCTGTNEPRRLIDTTGDVTDAHLRHAIARLAPDETMEVFRIKDFPERLPAVVAQFIGQGEIV